LSNVVVWNANSARIWWACPTCKVEAGITLPASAAEFIARLQKFTDMHSACAEPITAPLWRKES